MYVALGTALIGAVSGPRAARAVYELSVPFGSPPRTACSHCREPLPSSVVSRYGWAGRCGTCRAQLGPRVWLVALLCPVACALVGWRIGNDPSVIVFTAFAIGCVLLALIDVAVRRLPDVLTVPLAAIGLVGLATTSYMAQNMTPVLKGLIGAALAGGFFLALAWVRPDGEGMGLGDAKLAAVLGLYLGWLGWPSLTSGIFGGACLAAVYVGVMLATGRMDRKAAIPYGPFLLIGCWGVLLAAPLIR